MKLATANAFSALVLSVIIIHCPEQGMGDDIGTNFFLKASKSVPRIGRRSMDFDNHFLKASKSVPRIGRRGAVNRIGEMQDMRGVPVIRTSGPEVYFTETGRPLWSDFEKGYETFPRGQGLNKFAGDFFEESFEPYWQRAKKEAEVEEPRLQAQVF